MDEDLELEALRAEVIRLRNIEALRDILLGDLQESRNEINRLRIEVAKYKDAIDGMSMDMGLMEERINELSGREPSGDRYGP